MGRILTLRAGRWRQMCAPSRGEPAPAAPEAAWPGYEVGARLARRAPLRLDSRPSPAEPKPDAVKSASICQPSQGRRRSPAASRSRHPPGFWSLADPAKEPNLVPSEAALESLTGVRGLPKWTQAPQAVQAAGRHNPPPSRVRFPNPGGARLRCSAQRRLPRALQVSRYGPGDQREQGRGAWYSQLPRAKESRGEC